MPRPPLTDDSLMPFGKYKGKPMADVPASYLLWLWNDGLKNKTATSDVAAYIAENLHCLTLEDADTDTDADADAD